MKLIALVLAPLMLLAQSDKAPRCEAVPEVRSFLHKLDESSETMTQAERDAWGSPELARLRQKYPQELALAEVEYFWPYRVGRSADIPAARELAVAKAKTQPESVPALMLAGLALKDTRTPEAIQLLERARTLAPDNPWPYLKLSRIFREGKFANPGELKTNLEGYYRACPDGTDVQALYALQQGGTAEMWKQRAERLRKRLAGTTDPLELRLFWQVWQLEFRATPAPEHAKVRAQMGEDLKRLEQVPAPNASWLRMLADGRMQAGASKAEVAVMEDRMAKEFPQSPEVGRMLRKRWTEAHPSPKPNDAPEVWDAWHRTRLAWAEPAMRSFPLQPRWQGTVFESLAALPDSEAGRVTRAGEAMIESSENRGGKNPYVRRQLAEFYLKRGIQISQAVELLESVRTMNAESRKLLGESDNSTDRDAAKQAEFQLSDEIELSPLLARAYWRAGAAEKARSCAAEVDALKPADDAARSLRLYALGLLAATEKNTANAMTYMQAALRGRPQPPDRDNGRVFDPLLDDARAVFRQAGGSEAAWGIWAGTTKVKAQELTDGRWDKLSRPLPAFELTDLGGKKWSLKALEGKTLFINLWATSCGPCREELPHFQKLYEQTKGRADIAVFSLNIDEDLGSIAPFLKAYDYTFPVLPARLFVETTADMVAIPQNWVVDRQGVWKWQQFGFDDKEADWVAVALAKIASVQ